MHSWKILGLLIVCTGFVVQASDPEHEEENEGDGHAEDEKPHWAYHGEYAADNWGSLDQRCKSSNQRQSPIDIDHDVAIFDDDLTKVEVIEANRFKTYQIVNNGHSVNIEVPHEAVVAGGDLPSKGYRIAGVHFHWGSEDAKGSEHTVDTNRFPLEMHMVTYDGERYPELGTDAVFGDNSLAVLGTLFKISEEDNPTLKPLLDGLRRVQEPGSKTTIRSFPITDLLPEQTDKYFRYYGSLTTPPCAQSVVWTLFLHTQTISSDQLQEFRYLLGGSGHDGEPSYIVDNWRPVQPIHKRIVFRSFLYKSEMSKTIVNYGTKAEEASGHNGATTPVIGGITLLMFLFAHLL